MEKNYHRTIRSDKEIKDFFSSKEIIANRFGDTFSVIKLKFKNLELKDKKYKNNKIKNISNEELEYILLEISGLYKIVGRWRDNKFVIIMPDTGKEKSFKMAVFLKEFFKDYLNTNVSTKLQIETVTYNIKTDNNLLTKFIEFMDDEIL